RLVSGAPLTQPAGAPGGPAAGVPWRPAQARGARILSQDDDVLADLSPGVGLLAWLSTSGRCPMARDAPVRERGSAAGASAKDAGPERAPVTALFRPRQ